MRRAQRRGRLKRRFDGRSGLSTAHPDGHSDVQIKVAIGAETVRQVHIVTAEALVGRRTTPRKAAAARLNGRLGGRPRADRGPDGKISTVYRRNSLPRNRQNNTMRVVLRRCASVIGWVFLLAGTAAAQVPATANVDFARDVQPILRQHCVECHGPSQQMRGLRLDRRRDALPNRVGANGVRIVPGNSSASLLYRRLTGSESGPQMPPDGPLSQEQISVIKTWIDHGAEWPDALSGDTITSQPDPAVVRMMHALRNGDRQAIQPRVTGKSSVGEWQRARRLDADHVRGALRRSRRRQASIGARRDANAQNDGGGTALMYAIEDVEKTRLLLDRGADVNARSGEGRTALLIAVGRAGSNAVVKLLLEKRSKRFGAASGWPGCVATGRRRS